MSLFHIQRHLNHTKGSFMARRTKLVLHGVQFGSTKCYSKCKNFSKVIKYLSFFNEIHKIFEL